MNYNEDLIANTIVAITTLIILTLLIFAIW
jgi:hypothetical protein